MNLDAAAKAYAELVERAWCDLSDEARRTLLGGAERAGLGLFVGFRNSRPFVLAIWPSGAPASAEGAVRPPPEPFEVDEPAVGDGELVVEPAP